MSTLASTWRSDGSNPVVLVLPYAGAARMPLHVVRRAVDPLEVVSPVLPGHGGRLHEAPVADAGSLLGRLEDAVAQVSPRPVVLLGVSLGGRLAYELAWRLADAGSPPAGLVTCVTRAPHLGIGHRPIAALPLEDFRRAAFRLGLLAPELGRLPGTEPLVEALRADLAVLESMPSCRTRRLDVPAAVVGARSDWLVPEPALRAWSDLLVDPLQLRVAGGHLDWLHDEPDACAVVQTAVEHVLTATVTPTAT